jgi:SPP1 gp7 family putative phage head morphogenesis protein
VIAFTALPFDEAIAFFRDKVPLTPDQFARLSREARAKAFTVSGVARLDVITDLHAAIDRAITDGTTFNDFKKAVKGIMEKRGWEGSAPHRLETIFRTNIQSTYQAGHYERQRELIGTRPYWQYVAVMDARVRPSHAAMNGKVVVADDPWWKANYPPNGFNCRCTVRSLSRSELDRERLPVDRDLPDIADPGFDGNPGETMGRMVSAEQFRRLQADPARWTPLTSTTFEDYGRPPARDVTAYTVSRTPLWPAGKEAVDRYRQEMMGKTLTDVLGDPLVLNEAFIAHLTLDGRERFFPLIRDVLSMPYEIWLQAEKEIETGRVVLRKRYVALVQAEKGRPMLVVAEGVRGQWLGYTMFYTRDTRYLDAVRNGVLIYGRE